jgi:hypothetical protein
VPRHQPQRRQRGGRLAPSGPLQVGDHVTVRGDPETVGGVDFLSAFSTKISTALGTNAGADQPDYMVLDEMFIDAPGFQRVRIRDQFIGATTEAEVGGGTFKVTTPSGTAKSSGTFTVK